MNLIVFLIANSILAISYVLCDTICTKFEFSITQKIENEGFHRELKWLLEILSPSSESFASAQCHLTIQLDVPRGMYINPDEISELIRIGEISALIEGEVNVETPLHESTEHTLYIFAPIENVTDRISVNVPIHLRYQRARITGGFGKVQLGKPSLLLYCSKNIIFCGNAMKLEAPCDVTAQDTCLYRNITYQALFEDVELFVPIGDLDDYPLVSIVTLLLGCAGCIYILSILSTAPL